MLTRSSLEELGWTEAAGVSVPIRALTRFSDYEKLVKDWKEESLSSKDIRIMQCVNGMCTYLSAHPCISLLVV